MSDPRQSARRLWAYGPFVIGVVEIVAFVVMVQWVGWFWTILLALATSLVGFWALRLFGFRAWQRLRKAAAEGRIPDTRQNEDRVAGTGAGILAAVLLALPGFVTDLAGLLLLLPPIRNSVGRRLARSTLTSFPTSPYVRGPEGYGSHRAEPEHVVIEGEVVEPKGRRSESRDGRLADNEDPFDSDDPDGT